VTLYVSITSPCTWVRTDAHGRTLDRATCGSLSEVPQGHADESVIAVVPGEDVVVHKTRVPARRRAALLAALPYSLEEWLTEEPEDLHFVLLSWDTANEEVVAAVTARARMDAWLRSLGEAGIKANAVVPETLLVPIHPQTRATILAHGTGEYVVRGPGMEASVLDTESVYHWWQELADPAFPLATNDAGLARWLVEHGATGVSQWDPGTGWADWLSAAGDVGAANLLQGDYASADGQAALARLWPAAGIAALALVLALGVDGWDYVRLAREDRTLDRGIVELYQRTFPGARAPVPGRVRQQFAQRLKLSGSDGRYGDFAVLLAAVAHAVPPAGGRVEELNFRDNRLTVACSSTDFAGIERVKQSLEREPGLKVELLSSGAREQQVTARFVLTRVEA